MTNQNHTTSIDCLEPEIAAAELNTIPGVEAMVEDDEDRVTIDWETAEAEAGIRQWLLTHGWDAEDVEFTLFGE